MEKEKKIRDKMKRENEEVKNERKNGEGKKQREKMKWENEEIKKKRKNGERKIKKK